MQAETGLLNSVILRLDAWLLVVVLVLSVDVVHDLPGEVPLLDADPLFDLAVQLVGKVVVIQLLVL